MPEEFEPYPAFRATHANIASDHTLEADLHGTCLDELETAGVRADSLARRRGVLHS